MAEGFEEFADVFRAFVAQEEESNELPEELPVSNFDAMETEEKEDEEGAGKVSKKQRKKLTRLTVAELKQLVSRPDLVEVRVSLKFSLFNLRM